MKTIRIYPDLSTAESILKVSKHDWLYIDLNNFRDMDFDPDLLAKDYINLIGELGKKYNSVYWWASCLSEKNALNSKLFGQIYKITALDFMLKKHGDRNYIAVISDDLTLNEQINQSFYEKYFSRLIIFFKGWYV